MQVQPYYDFANCIDSDDELDIGEGSSEGSGGSADERQDCANEVEVISL